MASSTGNTSCFPYSLVLTTNVNQLVSYKVKSLHLSLGPSITSVNVVRPPPPSRSGFKDVNVDGDIVGIWRLVERRLGRNRKWKNLLNPMMWAAGASMVFIVKVDERVVGVEEMRRFRDHIDGHNKHVVRLGENILRVRVDDDEKMYRIL